MFYYMLSIFAAIGCAGNFAVTKIYQKQMGAGIREGIIFNIYIGLFCSVLFYVISGFKLEYTDYSFIMAAVFTLFVGMYTVIGFKIMSMGSMTVYTVFLMLGGAVVPYIYGILFLAERVNIFRISALLLVICSVLLNTFGEKQGKQSAKFILLCIAVFFLNGAVSVISKLHQIEKVYPAVSAESFVVLKSILRFFMFLMFLPFFGKQKKEYQTKKISFKIYIVMLASAVASGGSYFLQLIGAAHMPASVLYPVVTGGTIVTTSLFDRIFFRQRLSRNTVISIFTCVIALILFVV